MVDSFAGEAQLVSACLAGDKKAWDSFVERYSRLIYWSILRTLEAGCPGGRLDVAREIFQDLFVRLLDADTLRKLRNTASIRRFLCVTACYMTRDRIKHLYRRANTTVALAAGSPEDSAPPGGTVDDAASPAGNPQEALALGERERIIQELLAQLKAKERSCVEFYYRDGKTHREIAGVLGLPQDTVSTILRRAKEKLKNQLAQRGIQAGD